MSTWLMISYKPFTHLAYLINLDDCTAVYVLSFTQWINVPGNTFSLYLVHYTEFLWAGSDDTFRFQYPVTWYSFLL